MTNVSNASSNEPIIEMEWESVFDEISKLEGTVKKEAGGTTVYYGVHPNYGPIHIVVPMGDSGFLLPPVALRDF